MFDYKVRLIRDMNASTKLNSFMELCMFLIRPYRGQHLKGKQNIIMEELIE
jgi:hypothetical protein